MKKAPNYFRIGIVSSVSFFILSGVVSSVIPNPWFSRMAFVDALDYFFLLSSSILIGGYVAVSQYKKNGSKKCDAALCSGSAGSYIAFACPLCNKILVMVLGAAAIMTNVWPYHEAIGFISIFLMAMALYFKAKSRG